MEFTEETLQFDLSDWYNKNPLSFISTMSPTEPELLGIKTRIGNAPISRNLKKLIELSHAKLPPEIELLFRNHDIHMVTHAVGLVRMEGKATVKELQYNAEVIGLETVHTIDLLPNTTFKTIFSAGASLEGAVKAGGNFSAAIPDELNMALSGKSISLGGDIEVNLSSNAKFVGKIRYSVQLPVVTSSGVSSNHCTWILNPDANPLLGDQLLIQTIAVPKHTKEITYEVKAKVKIKKNFFSKTHEKSTKLSTITVLLDH